jgi:cell division protein FtsN
VSPGRTLSRDFKHVKRNAPGGAPIAFNGWTGFGLGLGLGLAVALGVHLHYSRQPAIEPQPETAKPPASARSGEEDPAAPATADPGASYDFYKMLPEQEVEVPKQPATAAAQASSLPKGEIVLQAGSFKSQDQAEKLKGRLAMYGVGAKIQRFTAEDETWYRVRIGPIDTVEEYENVRAKLEDADIDATPMTSVVDIPPN